MSLPHNLKDRSPETGWFQWLSKDSGWRSRCVSVGMNCTVPRLKEDLRLLSARRNIGEYSVAVSARQRSAWWGGTSSSKNKDDCAPLHFVVQSPQNRIERFFPNGGHERALKSWTPRRCVIFFQYERVVKSSRGFNQYVCWQENWLVHQMSSMHQFTVMLQRTCVSNFPLAVTKPSRCVSQFPLPDASMSPVLYSEHWIRSGNPQLSIMLAVFIVSPKSWNRDFSPLKTPAVTGQSASQVWESDHFYQAPTIPRVVW